MYRSDYCYECGVDMSEFTMERITGVCPVCEDRIKEEKIKNTIDK